MTPNEELLTLSLFALMCSCDETDPEDPEWDEQAVTALALIKMEIFLRQTNSNLELVRDAYRRATERMKNHEAGYGEILNELTKRLEEEL